MHTLNFIWSNGVGAWALEEDGRYVYNLHHPAAMEAVEQVRQWRFEHQVMGGTYLEDFIEGNVAFNMVTTFAFYRHPKNNMDSADWSSMPFPKGPNATEYAFPANAYYINVLPATSKMPEAMIELCEFKWRPEDDEDRIDGLVNAYINDRQTFEVWQMYLDNWGGEGRLFGGTAPESAWFGAIESVMNEELGVAAAAEANRQPGQAAFDDLLNQ